MIIVQSTSKTFNDILITKQVMIISKQWFFSTFLIADYNLHIYFKIKISIKDF